MNRSFVRTTVATLGLACALCLSACDAIKDFNFDTFLKPTSYEEAYNNAATAKAPVVASPTILTDGVLTVGIKSNAIAPLSIVNGDGTLMGIDIDLASSLANEMGLKVRFVSVSNVSESLGTTCDVLMDVDAGEDSAATVVGSYAESSATLFHKGAPITVSAAELEGATVGLQDGSLSQEALHNTGLTMNEVTFSSLNEAFNALESGSVDYVLCEAYPGAYLAAVTGGISYAGTLNVPTSIGIGVATENAALQASVQSAFDTIRSNGIMDLVRSKWIAGAAPLTNSNMVSDIPEKVEEAAPEENSEEAAPEEGGEEAVPEEGGEG